MIVGRPRAAARAATSAAVIGLLALTGCTIGGDAEGSTPTTSPGVSVDPTQPVPPPPSGPPRPSETAQPPSPVPPAERTDLEQLLDSGGLTDDDIGFPRLPETADDYGIQTPTQNLCEAVDETDARRVARVQHWWRSPGWETGEAPAVALSAELVVYDAGGGEAAMAAFQQTPTECPSRELEDGATVTFQSGEAPPGALPGSVALRSNVLTADGAEIQQVIVAQRVGDLVGYLYVTGYDATVTAEATRVSAILATRLTALAPQLPPG